MTDKSNIDDFIDTFTKEISSSTAAIFAGAGLSKASGFVDWKSLLRPVAKQLKLNVDKETDLIALTQYYYNEHGGRHRINQLIIDEFSKKVSLNENHQILARLPISTYWTTNYDNLIEDSLEKADKTPDVKRTVENLSINLFRRDAVVYKMHGDITQPDKAVITKDDYEKYDRTRHLFSTALEGDLVQKTFLFIGFSFSDPNIGYILGRIRNLLGENQREHYCLMQRKQRNQFNSQNEFQYAKTQQELQINDLKRYCIKALLVDEYADITCILKRIENKHKLRQIFISGSADVYDPFKKDDAQLFLHNLSKRLCEKNYSIVSGFGIGVGSAVINGVLEHVYSSKYQHIEEYLTLRPFPQLKTGKKELPELWKEYRGEMISKVGVAIFVYGNKIVETKLVNADGMMKEFNIAASNGLKIIPIGITGYASKDIWKIVQKDKTKYLGNNKKIHKLFVQLNNPKNTLTKCIDFVIEILNHYKNDNT